MCYWGHRGGEGQLDCQPVGLPWCDGEWWELKKCPENYFRGSEYNT